MERTLPFTRDLRPTIGTRYDQALNPLRVSERTRIGHVDTGVSRAISYPETGEPRFDHAGQEPDTSTDDVSGTSYAAQQVAAAAALWVETFFHQLPQPGDVDAWKAVEAFRAAVVESATTAFLRIAGRRRRIIRPRLDIERLLGRAPDLAAVDTPAPAAIRHDNQQ